MEMFPGSMATSLTSNVLGGSSRGQGAICPASTIAAPRKISKGVIVSCSLHFSYPTTAIVCMFAILMSSHMLFQERCLVGGRHACGAFVPEPGSLPEVRKTRKQPEVIAGDRARRHCAVGAGRVRRPARRTLLAEVRVIRSVLVMLSSFPAGRGSSRACGLFEEPASPARPGRWRGPLRRRCRRPERPAPARLRRGSRTWAGSAGTS